MKITIFAAGSRGDIQPCLALAKGLRDAGYRVLLAIPENYAGLAQEHVIEVAPLRGDVQQVMSGELGRNFLEKGGSNPLQSVVAMRRLIGTVAMDMVHDVYDACAETDGLICLGVFSPFGVCVAEALRIPLIHIEPTPLLPTARFPAPSWPIQRGLGGIHNYISGIVMLFTIWLWYKPYVRIFRQELGLIDRTAAYFYRMLRSTPMIGAYSPRIIPHPDDWPDSLHITGDLSLRGNVEWKPPVDLRAFLDSGDPPVYVGFGSMTGIDPKKLGDLLQRALEQSGQRGLLMTGWSGMKAVSQSDRIFILEYAPHDWLFPRMAAVVHHGGAGTTAEGVRAGVPSVIIPFAFDQFFWGARLREMGIGTEPIPRKMLTVDRLANAIKIAVTDPAMRLRAEQCGKAIRLNDSLANAVNVVRMYFGEPDSERNKLHDRKA